MTLMKGDGLDVTTRGVTLMTSKFLPSLQNLTALFPEEQTVDGWHSSPESRWQLLGGSTWCPIQKTHHLPISAYCWWSLVVSSSPFSVHRLPENPADSHPQSTHLSPRYMSDRRRHLALVIHSHCTEMNAQERCWENVLKSGDGYEGSCSPETG